MKVYPTVAPTAVTRPLYSPRRAPRPAVAGHLLIVRGEHANREFLVQELADGQVEVKPIAAS